MLSWVSRGSRIWFSNLRRDALRCDEWIPLASLQNVGVLFYVKRPLPRVCQYQVWFALTPSAKPTGVLSTLLLHPAVESLDLTELIIFCLALLRFAQIADLRVKIEKKTRKQQKLKAHQERGEPYSVPQAYDTPIGANPLCAVSNPILGHAGL